MSTHPMISPVMSSKYVCFDRYIPNGVKGLSFGCRDFSVNTFFATVGHIGCSSQALTFNVRNFNQWPATLQNCSYCTVMFVYALSVNPDFTTVCCSPLWTGFGVDETFNQCMVAFFIPQSVQFVGKLVCTSDPNAERLATSVNARKNKARMFDSVRVGVEELWIEKL